MIIKGLEKFSLIDYSPYHCCVVFTGGCNFRCGFCYNADLVLAPEKLPTISHDEFYQFLRENKKWLDAVCICGGEPTIHRDLPDHIARIKTMGYKVKLDTNGTNPAMVKQLIDYRLIDYVAMDIKAPLDKYETVVNVPVNRDKIQQTIDVLMTNRVPYEFRMTVVPTLAQEADFEAIGQWLRGAERFYLQQFRGIKCLNPAFNNVKPFGQQDLERFKRLLEPYIKLVEIRS